MASTLPNLGTTISFSNINTELGLASNRQISFNDVMVRGLHGSDASTQLSIDEFYNIYGIGNPYLANAQTRLVVTTTGNTTLPSLTRSVARVSVVSYPTQNTTATNQEQFEMYKILATPASSGSAGPPAVSNGYISILMNTNHSVSTGLTPSLRYVATAYSYATSGAGAVETITSADGLDFARIPGGISSATIATSRAKAEQIQTALIIQYNRYLRGTQANTDHVTAGYIRPV